MIAGQAGNVVVVDDEPAVCRAVANALERVGVQVRYFTRAVDCLNELPTLPCDLLIADLKMPEMDGMELLTKVKDVRPSLPVLILTGYGDIPTAVAAVKAGACDFVQKPLSRETLVSTVTSILGKDAAYLAGDHKPLTRTEIKVLRLILAGKNNREIANLLNRSVRTAEFHRGNIMRKLNVHNAVELTERVISLGLGLRH